MRTLVVYYSRTGSTRRTAEAIARDLEADLESIVEDRHRRGPGGYLRSAIDGLLRRSANIAAPIHDASQYDLVVVGGPVWFGNLAPPTRAYLEAHGRKAARIAFFTTMNGSGERRALAQMAEAAASSPVETAAFRRSDLERRGASAVVAGFVTSLRQRATEARAHEVRGPAVY